jgi:hypothetical protein
LARAGEHDVGHHGGGSAVRGFGEGERGGGRRGGGREATARCPPSTLPPSQGPLFPPVHLARHHCGRLPRAGLAVPGAGRAPALRAWCLRRGPKRHRPPLLGGRPDPRLLARARPIRAHVVRGEPGADIRLVLDRRPGARPRLLPARARAAHLARGGRADLHPGC